MKNSRFGRALAALFIGFVVCLGFGSCQNESDTEYVYQYVIPLTGSDLIFGTKWQDDFTDWNNYGESSYDFKALATSIETASYGAQTGTVYIRKLSETSGYIYYQISDTTGFSYSNKEASEYSGKWYAVFYKNLTTSSVKMCDAYPSFEASDPDTYKIADYHCADTLEDAVNNITVENGYFANPVDFVKVD